MVSKSMDAAGHPATLTNPPMAGALLPGARPAEPAAVPASSAELARWEADRMLTEIYREEYRSLVRLAMLLLNDLHAAEDVVQEAFIAMRAGWRRLRDTDKALAYLRRAVVNGSRSVLRHRAVVDRNAPGHATDEPSAESQAMTLLERSAVIAALRGLPGRQREAIVLRYYANLSEAEIAAAMRISGGSVKSHTSRGMAALRSALEHDALA
jgi:RNA polymerase sigma-70 factor (sigma-E family)